MGGGGHPLAVIDYQGRNGGVDDWSIGFDGSYGHPEGQEYDRGCVDNHFLGGRRRQVKQTRNNGNGKSFQTMRIGLIK